MRGRRKTGLRLWASSRHRLLDAAAVLTTPLLPDDYLGQLNPLWSTREPRGRVEAVMAETRDCVTLWLRPGRGWPAHVPGQYVRVGVDVDGVRHWRTYSLTSVPRRRDGRIAITVKRDPGRAGVRRTSSTSARQGMLVRLAPPTGEFVLPDAVERSAAVRHRRQRRDAGDGDAARARARAASLPDIAHVHVAPVARGHDLRRRPARAGARASPATRCTSTTTTGTAGGTSPRSSAACPTGASARPGRAARPGCWTR